jgi:hypothetical protein
MVVYRCNQTRDKGVQDVIDLRIRVYIDVVKLRTGVCKDVIKLRTSLLLTVRKLWTRLCKAMSHSESL